MQTKTFVLPFGTVEIARTMVDGYRDGKCTVRLDGQILQESHFRADIRHGLHQLYYTNGVKKLEAYYKNGALDGNCIMWHPNGTVMFEGNYIDGKRDGFHRTYDIDGYIKVINLYKEEQVDYKEWTLQRISVYKEELLENIFHPDRLERLAKKYSIPLRKLVTLSLL